MTITEFFLKALLAVALSATVTIVMETLIAAFSGEANTPIENTAAFMTFIMMTFAFFFLLGKVKVVTKTS